MDTWARVAPRLMLLQLNLLKVGKPKASIDGRGAKKVKDGLAVAGPVAASRLSDTSGET